jgi:hypothetical protein
VVEKLRRDSSFMHRVRLQGVQRLNNSLESSKFPNLRRNNVYTCSGTHSRGVRRDEEKVEAFWKFEIIPSIGRKFGSPGGAVATIRSIGK